VTATFDGDAQAGYLPIVDAAVSYTVTIRPDLLFDAAKDGRVVGVERLGGPVDVDDLADVIRKLHYGRKL
jgi:hypothetical protein